MDARTRLAALAAAAAIGLAVLQPTAAAAAEDKVAAPERPPSSTCDWYQGRDGNWYCWIIVNPG
jgi:hypothetical protein